MNDKSEFHQPEMVARGNREMLSVHALSQDRPDVVARLRARVGRAGSIDQDLEEGMLFLTNLIRVWVGWGWERC
jgi:hypothetical protein